MLGALVVPFLALEEARQSCNKFETFAHDLDRRWGFLVDEESSVQAPIWLGEFGTDEDNQWWRYLIRYLHERDVGFAYWPLNGEKRTDEIEWYGLLMEDSSTVRHSWKLEALQQLIERPFSSETSLDRAVGSM